MPSKQKVVVIVGPTAAGKSALGVLLARRYQGEVISADARQVYRGADSGTGKMTPKEMRGVPHHCLDIACARYPFHADRFRRCAQKAIYKIAEKGKVPFMVGGTGFYIDAALGRTQLAEVPANKPLRKKLSRLSPRALYARLRRLDMQRAKTIDPQNPRRLMRAIEIAIFHRTHKIQPHKKPSPSPYRILWIGVRRSGEVLKKRIQKRLETRESALIREVRTLHKKNVSWKRIAEIGIEYSFAVPYLRGRITRHQMREYILRASWQYVRRQYTWFRKNKSIHWVDTPHEALRITHAFLDTQKK